jgi:hypothetical protein
MLIMKLSQVLTLNAILFIAAGIGFTLYSPNVLAFFGVPELPGDSQELYWNIVSFARMFGAVLLTCGLLLWSLRSGAQVSAERTQLPRDILFSLVFGFIILTVTAITQQSSVWGSPAGWIITGVFALFSLIYIYFLAKKGM